MAKRKFHAKDIPGYTEGLTAHAETWQRNALAPSPTGYTDADRESICASVRGLYAAADMKAPGRVIFVPSTRQLTIGGPIATAIHQMTELVNYVGRELTRDELRAAVALAVEWCVEPGKITENATWNATWNATRNATENATRNATWNATRNATENATENATRNATRNATGNATENATRNATWNATRNATENATENATRNGSDVVERAADFLRLCTRHWTVSYNWGNEWSGYPAYLSYGRVVGRTDIDYAKWIHYERLAQVGPRYMHTDWCMVAERPIERNHDMVDGVAVLRAGRQVVYRDGGAVVDGAWSYGPGDDRVDVYDLVDDTYMPIATEHRLDEAKADAWAARAAKTTDDARAFAEHQMLAWSGDRSVRLVTSWP